MTDIETSKALALTIGHDPTDVAIIGDVCIVDTYDRSRQKTKYGWVRGRIFDYRDPAVIFLIAERYNCFPSQEYSFIRIELYWKACKGGYVATADTAAEAIALAVIRGAK